MTDPTPNTAVRDALIAALNGRAADPIALLNLNHSALQHDGVADADAIEYWVHKHSTPVDLPAVTTTPDPSEGGTGIRGSIEAGRDAYLRRHPTPAPGEAPSGTQAAGRDAYARRHRGTVPGAVS